MLDQFLGRRRPRLSRAAAAVAGNTEHASLSRNRPTTQLNHRASPPQQRPQRSTTTTSRRVRRVSLSELFGPTQRHTISETSSYRSASDQTQAILNQLQSGQVLIMDQTCYADFGNDHDGCLPVLLDSCCPICLVDWQYGERVKACPRPCQHVFHVPCLAQWLDASSSTAPKQCPCCRWPLDPTAEQQDGSTTREITRLRLPTADPLDLALSSNHDGNADDAILWSAINMNELDVDTVMDNMSEMAVADGGQGITLTYFRLPPDESVPSANHSREGDNRPSLTSVNAVGTTNLVDLGDVSNSSEDPPQPSRRHRPPRPPVSDLKERLRPWMDSERGTPPDACAWMGHVDSVNRNCALCHCSYDATSRYTMSQDVNCPHIYHEECWLDYTCRYLLEHDDNDASEDDNHAAVDRSDTRNVPRVENNGMKVRRVPCVCCHRPYLCVPEDIVVVPNRSQQNLPPRRQHRLPSF